MDKARGLLTPGMTTEAYEEMIKEEKEIIKKNALLHDLKKEYKEEQKKQKDKE